MEITKRQLQLVEILIKQKGFLTVNEYAKKLSISQRTVHTDLNQINDYMLSKGYEIVKQPGRGISIKHLKNQVTKDEVSDSQYYSTEGRRLKIIELLLFENRTITFEYLSETFMVSKSSISYDLKFINLLLTNGNNAKLVSDIDGTRIVGNESDIQKSFQEFNLYLFKLSNNIFENDESEKIEKLSTYYGDDIVKVCSRVLFSYMKVNSGVIAEHYVINILSILIIMIYRMKNGFNIEKNQNDDDVKFETIAETILKKISLRIPFEHSEGDTQYLSKYLKSYHFAALPDEYAFQEITQEMVRKVSESLNINLNDNQILIDHLNNHIPPMVFRLQQGVHIKNPFLKQIKKEFSMIFNLIWLLLSEYEEEWKVVFNEDEIGFLTIHFQSTIEKLADNKKILVVCPTGIATSELLVNRLINILPKISTIEVASAKEIHLYDLNDIDLIVTTTSLDIDSEKIVVVSPLLNEDDKKSISKYFNNNIQESNDVTEIELTNLSKVIDKNTIFINQDFNSHESLLNVVGKKLVNLDIIHEEFINSVKNRENLGGTDLPQGIAIPHGNPKYVKNTSITIIINKRAFKWMNEKVQIIFLVCISEQDSKKIKGILSDIYTIVQNEKVFKLLKEAMDREKVLDILGG